MLGHIWPAKELMGEMKLETRQPAFCSSCGAALEAGMNFCPACGHNVAPPSDVIQPWEVPVARPAPLYADEIKVIPADPTKPATPVASTLTPDAPEPWEVPVARPTPLYAGEVTVIPAEPIKTVTPVTPTPLAPPADGHWSADGKQWIPNCLKCGAALEAGMISCSSCGYNVVPVVRVPVAQSKADSAAAIAARTVGQYSRDGKWWWNGTQWTAAPGVDLDAVAPVQGEDLVVRNGEASEVAAPVTVRSVVTLDATAPRAGKGVQRVVMATLGLLGLVGLGLVGLLVAAAGLLAVAATWWNPKGVGKMVTKLAARAKLPGVKSGTAGWKAAVVLAISLVVVPGALGVLGQYVIAQVKNLPTQVAVTGAAYVASPLSGATVSVWEMGKDGKAGALLGTTKTDKNGTYALSVDRHPGETLLVTTAGGTYADQAFLKPTQAGAQDSLRTVLPVGVTDGLLTPLTTMAEARTQVLMGNGQEAGASYDISYSAVARQYGLESIDSINPAVANDPEEVAGEPTAAREEGLVLSGMDAEAYSLGVSNFQLADALAQDLSDGNLDGKQGNQALNMDVAGVPIALPADAGLAGLQQGIDTFAKAKGNATHLDAPQISLVTPDIQLNTGGLYVTSNALPAFVDGVAARVNISGSGGTPPYSCTLTGGALPEHFSLEAGCQIAYDGTKVLGSSTRRVVGPFAFKMQDTPKNGAKMQTVKFEIPGITLVGPPPVIVAVGGNCKAATVQCTVTAAHASGGSPPYFFQYGTLTNSPLGLFVSAAGADALLKGKPAASGTYDFSICVTDLSGAQGCTLAPLVHVVVGEAPSPSPSPVPTPTPKASPVVPSPIPTPTSAAIINGWPTNLPDGTYDLQLCQSIYNGSSWTAWTCSDQGFFSRSQALYLADQGRYTWQQTMYNAGLLGRCTSTYTAYYHAQTSFKFSCPGSVQAIYVTKS